MYRRTTYSLYLLLYIFRTRGTFLELERKPWSRKTWRIASVQLVEFQVKDERELDRMVRDVVIGKAIMYKVYDPRARRSKTGV